MRKIGLVILVFVGILLLSACQGPSPSPSPTPAPAPKPAPTPTPEPTPADQMFSLAISDDSGGNKNGAPILTLKFGEGTPNAITVVAKKGTAVIDGKDGDAAWGQASEVNLPLPVQKGGGPSKAMVKAAYDSDNIYFQVKWEDPTKTENIHKAMWTYNGADKTWKKSGNEDRVYFLFNINATDFNTGCAVYCHVGNPAWDVSEDKMGTNNPGESIDVWHWKAARTNPEGHADDKHWVDLTQGKEITYEGAKKVTTRLADSGGGFYSDNKENDLPQSMHKDDPGANVAFLFTEDAVAFDPNANWKDGDTIPGYVLKEGEGSRADVVTVATYTGGTWVVEFQRSLITDNPDDVQFK